MREGDERKKGGSDTREMREGERREKGGRERRRK